MRHLLIALLALSAYSTIHALDQLPDDLFKLLAHEVLLRDHTYTSIFSITLTSKKLCKQSADWCQSEQNLFCIKQLLFSACNHNAMWTVAFVLRNKELLRDKKRASAIVGACINAEHTSFKKQKFLSKRFPWAIEDQQISQGKPLEKTLLAYFDTRAAIFLKNGFVIVKLYDKRGHSLPALHHLITCSQPFERDSFIQGYKGRRPGPPPYKEIEMLLQHGANPSYVDEDGPSFTPADSFECVRRFIGILTKQEAGMLTVLLNKYKREPKNTTDIIYPRIK